ncbi:MAG: hypothetical protein ACRESQ_06750 [Gammaproteobacteria bacterium]
MTKIADATFKGQDSKYEFEVFPMNTSFNTVGAVYIFTKRIEDNTGKGTHTFLYIGQTESLADRISNHEKWSCVNRNGANCICVHRDNSEHSRLAKETDLRAVHDTPCNDQ